MEGPRLRDASYSRHSPRPMVPPPAAAGKKLRHNGKKDSCTWRPDQLCGYVQPYVHLQGVFTGNPYKFSMENIG